MTTDDVFVYILRHTLKKLFRVWWGKKKNSRETSKGREHPRGSCDISLEDNI